MMEENTMKTLLDEADGIREEVTEKTAVPVRKKRILLRIASAVAVLALLIGIISLLRPDRSGALDRVGETVRLKTRQSDLYPGKDVYIIDISLEDYDGGKENLDLDRVWVHHKSRPVVQAGKKQYDMAVQWLSPEEDGMFGLRIIGWCEDNDYIALHIWDKDGMVVCDKYIEITQDNGYTADVRRSFVYRESMTTDELIDKTFLQDYWFEMMTWSGDMHSLLIDYCGFEALTKRPDAASKMLERYERIVNGEELYSFPMSGYGSFGAESYSNDYLIEQVLRWSEFWKQLTEEEKARYYELVELNDVKYSQQ